MGSGGMLRPLAQPRPPPSAQCGSSQSQASPFLGRVDVVICLSTTVRNDTLQEVKEHRVSLKCRKQLRVEELEMVTPCSPASGPRNRRAGLGELGEGRAQVIRFQPEV